MLIEAAKDVERKCEENQYVNRGNFSSTLFLVTVIPRLTSDHANEFFG